MAKDMREHIELHRELEAGGPGILKPGEKAVPLEGFNIVEGPIRHYRMKCIKCGGKPMVSGEAQMTCTGCGHTSGELADFRQEVKL